MDTRKVLVTSLAVRDTFTYCGRTHVVVSISSADENGRHKVVTDKHTFSFRSDQKVSAS